MSKDHSPKSALPEELRSEAALWFSRMRGPNADACRPEFEAWLSRDPANHHAYGRIAGAFNLGKVARHPANSRRLPAPARHVKIAVIGTAIAAMIALIIVPVVQNAPRQILTEASIPNVRGSGIRTMRLPDGSMAIIDAGTRLEVAFDEKRRLLKLEHGRARFDVAHGSRPFVVDTGRGTVTARGTRFDVNITPRGVMEVSLLRGAVDVTWSDGTDQRHRPVLRTDHLRPGQALRIAVRLPAERTGVTPDQSAWLRQPVEFDEAPISRVLEEAGLRSDRTLSTGSDRVGNLRVSGRFRVDDAERVARNLAATFDLDVVSDGQSGIVLREK